MKNLRLSLYLLVGVLLMGVALPQFSMAAPVVQPNLSCTQFDTLATRMNDGTPGMLSSITDFIQTTVSSASKDLFGAFTSSSQYQNAVMAAATLMVVFYGVGFTIGIVQASFGQVLKRLIILGIIFTIISPGGWNFFNEYVVTFFNTGTDQLIGGVIEIGTNVPYNSGDSPFVAIDGIAKFVISPDMIIAMVGATTSGGPFGLMMGFLLGGCFLGLLKLLIEALRIYAVSYILRALLLGVAPVFIVFLLFEKTKPMFASWINALLNLSLQPILFFTFLSFFLVLIGSATKDMLGGAELCWTETPGVVGTPNKRAGWKFVTRDKDGKMGHPDISEQTFKGSLSCQLTGSKGCAEFPVNILDLLTFLILIYVATKFAGVVDNIANEISNTFVSVGQQAKFDMLRGEGAAGGSLTTNAGGAGRPGGDVHPRDRR